SWQHYPLRRLNTVPKESQILSY
ncbi:transposase, partial [Shigella flexneri]